MRIVKEHSERRNEILDAAERLFASKGYTHTTINDILAANAIAKGTFYHYFSSKEAVMDAVIARNIETEMAAAKEVAEHPALSAQDKMFRILSGAGRDREHHDRLEHEARTVHDPEMHQRTMAAIVLGLSPILTSVVQQGMAEGTYRTEYPQESLEILLAASEFLLHATVFHWSSDELLQKAKALAWVAEQALGAESGHFRYLYAPYEDRRKNND